MTEQEKKEFDNLIKRITELEEDQYSDRILLIIISIGLILGCL